VWEQALSLHYPLPENAASGFPGNRVRNRNPDSALFEDILEDGKAYSLLRKGMTAKKQQVQFIFLRFITNAGRKKNK